MKSGALIALLKKARATNARRSADEREVGFKAPEDCDPDLLLRTAMDAIYCGLAADDMDAVAEGYEMLDTLHVIMKGVRRNYDGAP